MSDDLDAVLHTEHPVQDFFGDLAYIFRAAAGMDRRATWLTAVEYLSQILYGLVPVALGAIVTAVTQRTVSSLWWAGILLVATFGLPPILGRQGCNARIRIQERVGGHFDQRIAALSGDAATVDHLEHPQYQHQVQNLKDRQGALGNAFNTILNSGMSIVAPVTVFIVALAADWRMVFAILASGLSFLAANLFAAWDEAAEKSSAEPGKLTEHLMELTMTPTPAAEIRVLGARTEIRRRIHRSCTQWRSAFTGSDIRQTLVSLGFTAIYFSAAGAVLVFMVIDAVHGRVEPANVVMALASIGKVQSQLPYLVWTLTELRTLTRTIKRYRWLEDHCARVAATHAGTAIPPVHLQHGIRLDHVTFSYPGSERHALDDISLDLPAGAVVAVVGENGAGKSTLIKALTGMYDLAGGRISIDGTPLTEMNLPDWRQRCSGAFQDHFHYELTAREAIGIGDLGLIDDDARIHEALDEAAATDVLAALPDGLDTQLGTEWDGVELSGGQWQRLAIARGMMRIDPLLLVLDEPTSALDAATEDRLFSGYTSAARKAKRHGAITLLVTHRFSTVSAADMVVVMDAGRIVEQGTHADLVRAGGTYAELYALQAAGYASS